MKYRFYVWSTIQQSLSYEPDAVVLCKQRAYLVYLFAAVKAVQPNDRFCRHRFPSEETEASTSEVGG